MSIRLASSKCDTRIWTEWDIQRHRLHKLLIFETRTQVQRVSSQLQYYCMDNVLTQVGKLYWHNASL